VKTLLLIGYLFLHAFTTYSNDQVEKLSSYDSNVLKDLTARWNNCLVKKDLQTLATLYADLVSVYGISVSKSQVISSKKEFFKLHPDFSQSIQGTMAVSLVADQKYKVSFPKHSSFNGKSIDVQGYLIFIKISGNWKIVTESDDVTDKNRLLKGTVKEKNGGTSIGITLEGSPHPEKDDAQEYSKTYDFNLHETFSERMTVIERFSFNPEDKQFYMINAIEDILNPIDFDRSLLLKFDVLCK
jgi:hypothetical protein